MTALRAKFIRDLTVRGRAQSTQRSYIKYVAELARHYGRSFATHLIESDVELPVVQHLMGHSNLRTTAGYLHVTQCRLAEVRSPLDLIDTSHIEPIKR